MHTTELRMLRWARRKTRRDHLRNVELWKEARIYPMVGFLRAKRFRWFGHVQSRDKAKKNIADDNRRKAKSRQTKAEMARPGEIGCGMKLDDN